MTKNDDSDGELPCKLRAKNLIFRFLQSKARIQIWLFEQKDLRIKYCIIASQVALVVPNPSATGFMASQEAVITRVAALGRGATTTGFKRFLALTEASKYKKNGPSGSFFIHNEEWN
ncbi:hypothetical protein HN51_012062 [Arachis hypogaea]